MTWPETEEEELAYLDWQREVEQGKTLSGFRDWLGPKDVETVALTAVPVGAHEGPEPQESPAPTSVRFPALTGEEKAQYQFLRQALSGLVDTIRPRAVVTVVEDKGDEQMVTPLALFLDEELFEAIMPPPNS